MAKKTLTTGDILHIAKLGNLTLNEKEIELFKKQLSSVIEYINKLQEVDTKTVEPTSQVTGLVDVFREDKTNSERTLNSADALKNAKSKTDTFFKVKAVLTD
jgi:aspartyl-tRNA(Asn)/glutamyl-tRNA(Gln) amidotransferase subunit C